MSDLKDDLIRRWLLVCDATGLVTIHERGDRPAGTLPVFSTDLAEQAVALRMLHCVPVTVGDDLTPCWQLEQPPKDVHELLTRITPMFRDSYRALALDAVRRAVRRHAIANYGRLIVVEAHDPRGKCPGCGDVAIDGKVTCGRAQCGPSSRWS